MRGVVIGSLWFLFVAITIARPGMGRSGTHELHGNVSNWEVTSDRHVIIISVDGFTASHLWDIKAPIPTIRKLAETGAWAPGMKPTNPTVTWPNHTTMVTGVASDKHHLMFNAKVERMEGGLPVRLNPRQDKQSLVAVPTLYDIAYASGLTTADVNWPATRNAGTLHDSFPDTPDNVGFMTDDLQWEVYEQGILEDMTTLALWQHSTAGRDRIWTNTAIHLIRNRFPNLMMVHLLNVDYTMHVFGHDTQPVYTALALADYHVKKILDAVRETGKIDKTTFFIVSDHGFIGTPSTIFPNLMLRDAGLLEVSLDDEIIGGEAQVLSTGGFGMIYMRDPSDFVVRDKIIDIFSNHEAIFRVYTPDEYDQIGIARPSESDQSGDLVIFCNPGFAMSASVTGDQIVVSSADEGFNLAHHGFHNDFPQMQAVFIANGNGIRSGTQLEEVVSNLVVAPTVAHLLGLKMPGTVLGPLMDILD